MSKNHSCPPDPKQNFRRASLLVCIPIFLGIFFYYYPKLQGHKTISSADAAALTDPVSKQIIQHADSIDSLLALPRKALIKHDAQGEEIFTTIRPLPQSYARSFPDLNSVQLTTASRLGIAPCGSKKEVESQSELLVKLKETPYIYINKLDHSHPYLVPRAARLLERIAQNFQDSLKMKGESPHQLVVTSVLRTQDDVKNLRSNNRNATSLSCHLFATTFDISYTHFRQTPSQQDQGEEGDPYALKMILGEVLRDLRHMGACYIKYEVHQACFHITVR